MKRKSDSSVNENYLRSFKYLFSGHDLVYIEERNSILFCSARESEVRCAANINTEFETEFRTKNFRAKPLAPRSGN